MDDLATLVDQELGKVPVDSLAEETFSPRLEVLEDFVGVAAVDVALLEERERDSVVALADGTRLRVVFRVLVAKLIAGEAEDDEALVLVLLVEFLEAGELG